MTGPAAPSLATIYHDPLGVIAPRIEPLWRAVGERFAGVAAVVTSASSPGGCAALERCGAVLEREGHPPAGLAGIGRARRNAVALALRAFDAPVLYADLDHALRWGEDDPADVTATASASRGLDLCVVGRGPRALAELPATLGDTEAIVNRVFAAATGWSWDVMSGVRCMSRQGAHAIVSECTEDSVANDVVWPLLLRRLGGHALGYVESPVLRYEDDEQFATRGDAVAWRRRRESDPASWARRLEIALLDVRAIAAHTANLP